MRALTKDNTRHGMWLTVDGDGQVSLWDTQEAARCCDKVGEGTFLHLHLTATQRATIMVVARRQQNRDEARDRAMRKDTTEGWDGVPDGPDLDDQGLEKVDCPDCGGSGSPDGIPIGSCGTCDGEGEVIRPKGTR
jgi:DnaJ-class molecular chaperone